LKVPITKPQKYFRYIIKKKLSKKVCFVNLSLPVGGQARFRF
jgi:hypothetical protein